MTVAFDNTMLSVLLNPDGKVPCYPGTKTPVDFAKARADAVVQSIASAGRKIVLPTPACAELLTAIGPDAQQYLEIVSQSRVFEVAAFDARCAIELAILNREVFRKQDEREDLDTYQKRKVDRQIIAICKVVGATEIFTDDRGLSNRAKLCGITPVSIADCPVPDSERQGNFFQLAQHEELPKAENDDEAKDAG